MSISIKSNSDGVSGALQINGIDAVTFNSSGFTGNAATATAFSTSRTNYKGVTDAAVAGQMMWKNYGNGHTIFDASNSTSPSGSAVNNTTSDVAWTGTYPTLMGWNGANTYGVRVDSARLADTASGVNITTTATSGNYFLTFVASQSNGNQALYIDNSSGSYDPNTNLAGINITGNAATATTATSASNIDGIAFNNSNSTNPVSAPDSLDINGIGYVTNISLLGQVDGALHSQAFSSSWQHQIFGDYRTGQMAVRGKNNNVWQAWRTVLDSTNIAGTATTFTVPQNFTASGILLKGSSTGYTTLTSANASGAFYTVTIPAENMTVGFRNVPPVGTKAVGYSLTPADVGKYVQLTTGGAITIPNATFAEGDVVSLFNNTAAAITITCSTTAYISGVNTVRASMSLATRGVATILFISSTLCVISGNVS